MSNAKFVIDEAQKLQLKDKETDVVVISFDINEFDFETVKAISDQVVQNFTGYTIGFIPKGMEVEIKDIDSMIQYLEDIKKNGILC